MGFYLNSYRTDSRRSRCQLSPSSVAIWIGIVGLWAAGVAARVAAYPAWTDRNPESIALLIVAPAAWQADIQRYAQARSPGVAAEVVTLESLMASDRDGDPPEKIKRYLFERWKAGNLTHLLLVGDCGVMPVRYMVLDRAVVAAADYAFYPSDLYYADLARRDGTFDDWNQQRDDYHAGYFGEVRGEKNKSDPINFDQIDYRPEIAVGRWPVQTREQLATIIEKSLAYEQLVRESNHPGLGRATLLAVDGWVDSRTQFDAIQRHLAEWDCGRRYYADAGRDDGTPPPNASQLAAAVEQGVGLIFHAGHGETDGWHRCLALREALDLKTARRWPILLSAGCSTAVFAPQAPYDGYLDRDGHEHPGTNRGEIFRQPPPPPASLQPERFDPTSMGEKLVVGTDAGAVAYFGCTTGSQPCGLTLLEGMAKTIGAAPSHITLGEAWVGAIHHYYEAERLEQLAPTDSWYPPSVFFQGMKFVLFGDPSLPLPHAAPAADR